MPISDRIYSLKIGLIITTEAQHSVLSNLRMADKKKSATCRAT